MGTVIGPPADEFANEKRISKKINSISVASTEVDNRVHYMTIHL